MRWVLPLGVLVAAWCPVARAEDARERLAQAACGASYPAAALRRLARTGPQAAPLMVRVAQCRTDGLGLWADRWLWRHGRGEPPRGGEGSDLVRAERVRRSTSMVTLREAVTHPHALVRRVALERLTVHDGGPSSFRVAAERAERDPDVAVRLAALVFLRRFGSRAQYVMRAASADDHGLVRRAAVLGWVALSAEDAQEAFDLFSKRPGDVLGVTAALGVLRYRPDAVVPMGYLLEAAELPSEWVRLRAVLALRSVWTGPWTRRLHSLAGRELSARTLMVYAGFAAERGEVVRARALFARVMTEHKLISLRAGSCLSWLGESGGVQYVKQRYRLSPDPREVRRAARFLGALGHSLPRRPGLPRDARRGIDVEYDYGAAAGPRVLHCVNRMAF